MGARCIVRPSGPNNDTAVSLTRSPPVRWSRWQQQRPVKLVRHGPMAQLIHLTRSCNWAASLWWAAWWRPGSENTLETLLHSTLHARTHTCTHAAQRRHSGPLQGSRCFVEAILRARVSLSMGRLSGAPLWRRRRPPLDATPRLAAPSRAWGVQSDNPEPIKAGGAFERTASAASRSGLSPFQSAARVQRHSAARFAVTHSTEAVGTDPDSVGPGRQGVYESKNTSEKSRETTFSRDDVR